jgi:hypothetical protein
MDGASGVPAEVSLRAELVEAGCRTFQLKRHQQS